jgi:glycerol-3-phosphate dehydrogenase
VGHRSGPPNDAGSRRARRAPPDPSERPVGVDACHRLEPLSNAREHGVEGLVSLIGIRYTMARGDAAQAIDLIARELDRRASRPRTDWIPVFGGAIESFEAAVQDAVRADRFNLLEPQLRAAT